MTALSDATATRRELIEHLGVALREFAPGTATVGEHARQFLDWVRRGRELYGPEDWIAVDPAAAVFKAELFALGVENVMNAHNRVVPGIQTVSSL